jgi:hypothetical protein
VGKRRRTAPTNELQIFLFVWWVTKWLPEPVYASPARLLPKRCCLQCRRFGHYGSEEATTVGHRRMVVPGAFAVERASLSIFVVA